MYVQQRLDVEVFSCQNDFKKYFLIDSNELLIPFADIGCTLASIIVFCSDRSDQFLLVIFTVFQNLGRRRKEDKSS